MAAMARLTPLLFVLWVGATVSTVVDLQKRIIGGQQCGPTERLYHVKLLAISSTHSSLCGGSLISDQWILTAAHCWIQGRTMNAVVGVHPGPGQTVQITAPPVIFRDKNNRDHDIMLLKLPNPTNIRPVGLPDCRNQPNIGSTVQMAGFAATTAGRYNQRIPGRSATLQCVNIQVVDCQRLRNILQNNSPSYHYQHWNCYQTPGVDTCPGDSGGGVVYNHRIYGVHVLTGNPHYACAEAAAFMNVCHPEYIQWIRNTIASPKKCLWCG